MVPALRLALIVVASCQVLHAAVLRDCTVSCTNLVSLLYIHTLWSGDGWSWVGPSSRVGYGCSWVPGYSSAKPTSCSQTVCLWLTSSNFLALWGWTKASLLAAPIWSSVTPTYPWSEASSYAAALLWCCSNASPLVGAICLYMASAKLINSLTTTSHGFFSSLCLLCPEEDYNMNWYISGCM